MNTEETFKEKLHHRFWLGSVMCRLFHPIETLENCSFVDSVSGKSVGKFRCKKCGGEYLANSKRDMFRCYVLMFANGWRYGVVANTELNLKYKTLKIWKTII